MKSNALAVWKRTPTSAPLSGFSTLVVCSSSATKATIAFVGATPSGSAKVAPITFKSEERILFRSTFEVTDRKKWGQPTRSVALAEKEKPWEDTLRKRGFRLEGTGDTL